MNPETIYVVDTTKSFEQASEDLDRAVKENGFGVLGLYRTRVDRIGMIKPQRMLASLSSDPALAAIARQVEAKTISMIDAAA